MCKRTISLNLLYNMKSLQSEDLGKLEAQRMDEERQRTITENLGFTMQGMARELSLFEKALLDLRHRTQM